MSKFKLGGGDTSCGLLCVRCEDDLAQRVPHSSWINPWAKPPSSLSVSHPSSDLTWQLLSYCFLLLFNWDHISLWMECCVQTNGNFIFWPFPLPATFSLLSCIWFESPGVCCCVTVRPWNLALTLILPPSTSFGHVSVVFVWKTCVQGFSLYGLWWISCREVDPSH